MDIGIFTKTFERDTFEEVLDAVEGHGYACVQLNWESVGLDPMPGRLDDKVCDRIREAADSRGLGIAAVSGTTNMIHPDPAERADGMRRLKEIIRASGRVGTSVVTLCTGTRDAGYMWRRHPDNDTPKAWQDLLRSMSEAAKVAEDHGVALAFEPEVANTVDSARKARRLLDEIGSPNLKVAIDGANVFHEGELARMSEILDEAFDLLGPDIALVHAKDLDRDGAAGNLAAGTGLLDFDRYAALLKQSGFGGGWIAHGLEESQAASVRAFLADKVSRSRNERCG
ncbi:MAG: sugar phosphate isomerase/epimerase [Candidatus Latescibacteria bacterium]|jgi:sugar phosphate isomerase/epimerase|nr:sugar phosphate isomerase/epimerase [Candidatus Latescibacterota bacterium]